jgi:hypothetical protein
MTAHAHTDRFDRIGPLPEIALTRCDLADKFPERAAIDFSIYSLTAR